MSDAAAPALQPQLHSQLPAQTKGCNPTLGCTGTSVGLGYGTGLWSQIHPRGALLPAPLAGGPRERREAVRALFQRTAPQLLSGAVPHQAALGTSHSFWGQESGALTEAEKKS